MLKCNTLFTQPFYLKAVHVYYVFIIEICSEILAILQIHYNAEGIMAAAAVLFCGAGYKSIFPIRSL